MKTILITSAAALLVFVVLFAVMFGRVFRLWLQCQMSGARVSLLQIFALHLRRSPVELICRQRIKARYAGIDLSAAQLEWAHLQGADIEKMVDAMLLAFRTDRSVTWEQLVEAELGKQSR